MTNSRFSDELRVALERNRANDWADNWDERRFGPCPQRSFADHVVAGARRMLQSLGLRSSPLTALMAHEEALQWLHERLQDDESQRLLVAVMAYRLLGFRKVKLPLNTATYWAKLDEIERKADAGDAVDAGFLGRRLARHDLPDPYRPIRLYTSSSGVFNQFLLQQYRCLTADHAIEVGAGETVIDAGGGYGSTALNFAHKAGAGGRVLSFEFVAGSLDVFRRNLEFNPDLARRIEIVRHAAWSCSNLALGVEGCGPATRVVSRCAEGALVETLSIDDLVRRKALARVDFIKMDIEGAELEALKGAEETMRRDAPRLAISVYHQLHDFWTIPRWIDALGLGYRFYLRHCTIHAEETMLFAETKR